MKDAWVQVTPSEYPWEREGLAFLKARLPDNEPFRAWANFEFLVDGTVSEVDVLVLARKGIFLVELKGWPGRITGDAGTWQWTPPNAVEPRLRDNPYVLANRKAKRLKGLLSRQKALRGKHVPFIRPLIFPASASHDPQPPREHRAPRTRRRLARRGGRGRRRRTDGAPAPVSQCRDRSEEDRRAQAERPAAACASDLSFQASPCSDANGTEDKLERAAMCATVRSKNPPVPLTTERRPSWNRQDSRLLLANGSSAQASPDVSVRCCLRHGQSSPADHSRMRTSS